MIDVAYYKNRWEELKNKRTPLERELKDIRDVFLPDAGLFPDDKQWTSNQNEYNDMYRQKVVNSVGTEKLGKLANALISTIMSPRIKWFRLEASKDNENSFSEERFLESKEKLLYDFYQRSFLYREAEKTMVEMIAFGIGCMSIEFDRVNGFLFKNYTIGSYYVDRNNQGIIDTIAVPFKITIADFIKEYGKDKLKESELMEIERNPNLAYSKRITIINIVEPNQNFLEFSDNPFNKKYISVHLRASMDAKDDKTILRSKGVSYFPYMCPTWSRMGLNVYGTGLGRRALASVLSLQSVEKDIMNGIKQGVAPLLIANPEMQSELAKYYRSGLKNNNIVYSDMKDPLRRAIEVNLDINSAAQFRNELTNQIADFFMQDLFFGISDLDKSMSATEVSIRKQEQMGLIGGTVDGIQNEFLRLIVENSWNILQSHGYMDDAPPSLQGEDLEIKYTSLLSQAQEFNDLSLMERFMNMLLGLAGAFPDAAMKVNIMRYVDRYSKKLGVEHDILNDAEEIEARQREIAQANQAANSQLSAKSMKDTASAIKDLSESKVAGDSALDMALGVSGGQS